LHNAGFASLGIDWVYTAFDVEDGDAGRALDAIRVFGLGGLSITMPHKEAVAALVDELDPAAAALASVNTVVPIGGGRLRGHSTDGAGFIASLEAHDVAIGGRRVGVVGAGAAGRAIVDAMARGGAAAITIVNRSPEHARRAAELAGSVAVVGEVSALEACDVIVNTTSVGMGSSDLPFDVGVLHSDQVVADIVYHPRRTALLAAADAVGARTVEGLGMLVHQAILQQRLWTGVSAEPSVLWAAAERELASRGQ
jgi:shikimate dehydrogenase